MDQKLYKLRLHLLSDEYDNSVMIDQLISSCFNDGDKLLLLCQREDSLLSLDESLVLREYIPVELQALGHYKIVDFRDSTRFSAVAEIVYSENSMNVIDLAWNYFYSLVICKTTLDFEEVISRGSSWFKPDLLCERGVRNKVINYCCIRGIDPDNCYFTFLGTEIEFSTLKEKFESSGVKFNEM